MARVIFKIAKPEQETDFIFSLKGSLDNLKERTEPCIFLTIPHKLQKKLKKAKKLSNNLRKELLSVIKKNSNKFRNTKLKKYLKEVKKEWLKVENIYFKEIEKLIGYGFNKKYVCFITDVTCGMYFDKNIVVLEYLSKKNRKIAPYIVAEELLHHLYWDFWMKIFKWKGLFDPWAIKKGRWRVWHVSEVIPEYLLTENPLFKKFGWNKINRKSAYPWIAELRKISDPLWEKRKNFATFVKEIHEKLGFNLQS